MNPLYPNIGTIPKIRQTGNLRLSYNSWFDKSRKFCCRCGVHNLADSTNLTEVSRTLVLNRRLHRMELRLSVFIHCKYAVKKPNIDAKILVERRRQKAEKIKNCEGNNFAFFVSAALGEDRPFTFLGLRSKKPYFFKNRGYFSRKSDE
ncbi:hypothetical protein [Microcoleus sp. B4-D4]|uniref:hypothetical protein n=1 Tax=Microcoleus sp. B4-D4 TaxID=2818667 RepID=UPI002FCF12CF